MKETSVWVMCDGQLDSMPGHCCPSNTCHESAKRHFGTKRQSVLGLHASRCQRGSRSRELFWDGGEGVRPEGVSGSGRVQGWQQRLPWNPIVPPLPSRRAWHRSPLFCIRLIADSWPIEAANRVREPMFPGLSHSKSGCFSRPTRYNSGCFSTALLHGTR